MVFGRGVSGVGQSLRDRQDIFRSIRPGPRVRMAARLYASGAVPTKRAACLAVGLSPTYLSVLDSAGNDVTTRLQAEVDAAIADETVALSKVITLLSRKAAGRMGELIQSPNEHVAVKASADILDRNPETSKTFKHSVTGLIISSEDAKELAAALVAGARVKEQYAGIAVGDFVKVEELDNGTQTKEPRQGGTQADHGSRETDEASHDASRDSDEGKATQGSPQKLRLLRGSDALREGEEEAR